MTWLEKYQGQVLHFHKLFIFKNEGNLEVQKFVEICLCSTYMILGTFQLLGHPNKKTFAVVQNSAGFRIAARKIKIYCRCILSKINQT